MGEERKRVSFEVCLKLKSETATERDSDGEERRGRERVALVNHADEVHSACMAEHSHYKIHFSEQSLTWRRRTHKRSEISGLQVGDAGSPG